MAAEKTHAVAAMNCRRHDTLTSSPSATAILSVHPPSSSPAPMSVAGRLHTAAAAPGFGNVSRILNSLPVADVPHRLSRQAAACDAQFHAVDSVAKNPDVQGTPDSPAQPDASGQVEARQRAVEAGYREGWQTGYDEGRQAGHKEAMGSAAVERQHERAAVQAQSRDSRRQLEAVLKTLRTQGDLFLAACENDMVALCFEALCQILGRSTVDPAMVRRQIVAAVTATGSVRPLEVRLHPMDLQLLVEGMEVSDGREKQIDEQTVNDEGAAATSRMTSAQAGKHRADGCSTPAARAFLDGVTLVADHTLLMGGCVIDGSQGGLDARLDLQLARLRDLLLETRNEWWQTATRTVGTADGRAATTTGA
jgi:flagellar assembly protein FliH